MLLPPPIGIVIITAMSLTTSFLILVAYHALYIDAYQKSEPYYTLQAGITDTATPKKD